MARNPSRTSSPRRTLRAEEEIRQLRIRPHVDSELSVSDLDPYLYKPNPGGIGSAFSAWEPVTLMPYGGGPQVAYAGFYVDRERCFLVGEVQWFGGSSNDGVTNLFTAGTPLPAYAHPPSDIRVTFAFDPPNCDWLPAPDGGADAYWGAEIEATVVSQGYIFFDPSPSNFKGRARKSDGSVYGSGVPDGSTLILEGISWHTHG